ncbi:MAG: outer membrane protein assembly factor BamA [Marinilabiliaceae bacterium]|nr:outer membrane protein assembly factor BamA [Marinilabiliaceae bacterium]
MLKYLIPIFLFSLSTINFAQTEEISYSGKPRKLIIAEIGVSGDLHNDPRILAGLSGLQVGQEISIPGEDITNAIKKYWDFGLFSDVKIAITKIEGRQVWLDIYLQERPRLSEINFTGLKKSERETILEKISMMKGNQVTPHAIARVERVIKNHFVDKGFYNTEVSIVQRDDTSRINHVFLDIDVDKKEKVKVNSLIFEGNEVFSYGKLNRITKKTNEKHLMRNFFRTKKFVEENYAEDRKRIIEKYNEKGYRDAQIVSHSVTKNEDNTVNIVIKVEEGIKYYFGEITWVGNTVYPSDYLAYVLRIKKGDVFNQTLLEKRLFIDEDAIINHYMNNGYLFSRVMPVDIRIEADTIDLEMRIYEGVQAEINHIFISGNTKTHEHVIRRELRFKPGQLFDRSAIIRSVRELAQLGHFDPEKINPVPIPDPDKGTVDIELNLEEKANDQIELSGGWGGGMFIASLGLKFTNFSIRNVTDFSTYRPLPSGDGQTLALRMQTQGRYFQTYSISFVEPWLGGKKPNALSVTAYLSRQTGINYNYYNNMYSMYNPYGGSYGYNTMDSRYYDDSKYMRVAGVSLGYSMRLRWPDDYFYLMTQLNYQRYNLKNWYYFPEITDGMSHSISLGLTLLRSSIDNPLYSRTGSEIALGVEFTPPYSLFSRQDYSQATSAELYRLIEFHKWTFKSMFFKALDRADKLVVMGRIEYGFLGYYNKFKRSPFGKYMLGGDGMSGYSYNASEMIGLRGYENSSLTAQTFKVYENGQAGWAFDGNMYSKMTLELRYPVILQPSATIWGLLFAEAGNSWSEFNHFNPFDLKRSAGFGIRLFLPMLGMMGIDWGYGFDTVPRQPSAGGGNFRFIMGKEF